MRKLIKETWLITAMYVVPIILLEMLFGEHGLLVPGSGTLSAIAFVVTPLTWWWLVARRGPIRVGRGAVAGSIASILILLVPILYYIVADVTRGPSAGEAGLGPLGAILFVVGLLILAIPLGAGLGALAGLLQKRWSA